MAKKTSNTGFGIVAPITAYSDQKEATDVSPNFIRTIPANVIGAVNVSNNLDSEDVSSVDEFILDDEGKSGEDDKKEDIVFKKAPLISDIELVSNSVVYDSTGTPSVTVIFKVRNSSEQIVKSVNARVQIA